MIKGKQNTFKPKIDRWDIYNNLPTGAQAKLARKLKVSDDTISDVLRGRRNDHHGIIKEAELMAAVNIWKVRFCTQGKTQL